MDDPKRVAKRALYAIPVGLLLFLAGWFGGSTLGTAMGFIVLSCAAAVYVVAAILAKGS